MVWSCHMFETSLSARLLHRGAFFQFPFQWSYYYDSNKYNGKETGKMHLCVLLGEIHDDNMTTTSKEGLLG